MIVSHRHRFIFLKTKKTAGTSVEIALSRICGPEDVVTGFGVVDEKIRSGVGGVTRQNNTAPPLEAPVFQHSGARRCRRAVGAEVFENYFRFVVERNPWDTVVSLYFWLNRNREVFTFDELLRRPEVETLARENYGMWHIHGEVAVDRVLRYERLADELDDVWRQLRLSGAAQLPHAKAGHRPERLDYRSMYDGPQRRFVGRLFERSIDELGYEF